MTETNPTILAFPAQPSARHNEQQNLRPLAIEDISDAHFAEAAEMWALNTAPEAWLATS